MTNAMPPHAVHEPIAAPRSSGGKLDDDDRQRARGQQRAEHALQRAPGDEHLDRRRQGADDAHDAEARDADGEDPPLAVEVAERAADEDERAEREQIGVGDPLLAGQAAAEVALDGRQGDVDRRRVEAPRRTFRGWRPAGRGACGDRSRTHATARGRAVPGQQATRSRATWGALRRVRPRGGFDGFRAAGLATPGPRSLRLGSASGRKLGWGPIAVKGPSGRSRKHRGFPVWRVAATSYTG